jgi:uncharacterized protein with von Willebrand factor type A (vWA) domain
MSRITKFTGRDAGASERIAGFIAHLRSHGFALGPAETQIALRALEQVNAADPQEVQSALMAICATSPEDVTRFEALFDAYWRNATRLREKWQPSGNAPPAHTRNSRQELAGESGDRGEIDRPDDDANGGTFENGSDGKLQATTAQNLMKKDMRELVSAQEILQAEQIARRLAGALNDRRSRRRVNARKGSQIDFRRTIRKSLATGGEPVTLCKRRRPQRPLRILALCDVSGSMTVYARVFLAFLAGLIRADDTADAYLFHTRLARITPALRDDDPLRALNRLTLLADGFGGGSKIGATLDQFSKTYARRFVDGRSVVFILSDGYDTDPPETLANALQSLKKRGCKIIWLNPMKGWKGYAPIAAGMAAALPYLDHFAAANTLQNLADLEGDLPWI